MRCKQTIKSLLQMVNIRKVENSLVNFQSNKHIKTLLKIFSGAVFTTFKQLVDHLLTTLTTFVEDSYHC